MPKTAVTDDSLEHAGALRRPKLLMVEDDDQCREWLECVFLEIEFHCTFAASLREAWEKLGTQTPDLVLLDEKLADGSGMTLCRRIRGEHRFSRTLIAIFTGRKSIYNGDDWLLAGADTCWPKTFQAARLKALVKGILRRKARDIQALKPNVPGVLIDPGQRVVTYDGRVSLQLSSRELLFLDLLFNSHPEPLSRGEIREKVFSYSRAENFDLALNELVRRLRKKLPGPLAESIEAVYRQGYRLNIPAKTISSVLNPLK